MFPKQVQKIQGENSLANCFYTFHRNNQKKIKHFVPYFWDNQYTVNSVNENSFKSNVYRKNNVREQRERPIFHFFSPYFAATPCGWERGKRDEGDLTMCC